MTLSNEIFGILAVAIGFIGNVPYFIGLFKGQIKPHIFSWIIWTLTASIVAFAQWSDGAGAGMWATVATALTTLVVSIYALKIGEKNITKSDTISFVIALLTIPIWYITQTPLWSVILIIIIDLFGFYPTFRKGYFKPFEEGAFLFAAVGLKFVFALFALENISLITALYPSLGVFLNGGFSLMLIMRRRIIAHKKVVA